MATAPNSVSTWRTPIIVIGAGSLVVLVAMGLRASLGLYLKPMSVDLGWGREVFAFALALQNLMWGVFQPAASAIADRWGTGRVVVLGGVLYVVGLFVMSQATDPLTLNLSAGLLVGMAQSGAGLAVVLGAVGQIVPDGKRSLALGVVGAAAAAGQLVVVPAGQAFLSFYGWSGGIALLALFGFTIVALAALLRSDPKTQGAALSDNMTLRQALAEAARHRGYWLLTLGFFVCGFHVSFVGVHLPAHLSDMGMAEGAGALSLMLIGLFNIFGSLLAGYLGGRFSKKYLLSGLYFMRSLVILAFITFPVTITTVVLFSMALGLLWLSTVPLTSGLVAQIFGPRYMATLFAFVFLSHQIGSFLGVWLGGYMYDLTGSYMSVWWAGVALGLVAALLHWPINETSVRRVAEA